MKVKDIVGDVNIIVTTYLLEHGYDGLHSEGGECACVVTDLAPCGDIQDGCVAGYIKPCNCGEHDYHIEEE